MINDYISELDMIGLYGVLNTLGYLKDDSGVLMANTQYGGVPDKMKNNPVIYDAFKELCDLEKESTADIIGCMVNIIPAGVIVPRHRDFLNTSRYQKVKPTIKRFHLPVQVNRHCWWWDEKNDTFSMDEGVWYGPMPYWTLHAVGNQGASPRIHLVIDIDTPVRQGEYKEDLQ